MTLILILTAFYSCIATDLSDLDNLYIETGNGLTVYSEETNQTTDNQTNGTEQSGTNETGDTTANDDSEKATAQRDTCELHFCTELDVLQDFYSVGDVVSFGEEEATFEGFYDLSDNVWMNWYNEQYGIQQYVKMIRYIYNKKLNDKTVVIETFYNKDKGEFLFARVLYQGEYDYMKNFIVKIYYENARPDFDAVAKFTNNDFSKYYENPDQVYYSVADYLNYEL